MATAMAMMVVDVIEKEVTNATYVVIALVMVAVGREVVDRAAARLVRLAQSGGSNGSLRPLGVARLCRVLCRASLAQYERGAKM